MSKSKYDQLTIYLIENGDEKITLTYKQIEHILGFELPPSAYDYQTIWVDGPSRPLPKSWIRAGYSVNNRFKDRVITFYKTGTYIPPNNKKTNPEHQCANFEKRETTLDIKDVMAAILRFHNRNVEGDFTRYRSWAHCYKAFQKHWQDNNYKDLLSLNLAWYLASWGMLRNSGLMDFDYKIHRKVIEKLTDNRFESLFKESTKSHIHLVFEAVSTIKDGYSASYNPTETAITKILLGIFGCTPAFDRFFISAAIKYNLCEKHFTIGSLTAIWNYYEINKKILEKLRNDLSIEGVKYTPMKLMDMALFQLGKEDDEKEKALKKLKDLANKNK